MAAQKFTRKEVQERKGANFFIIENLVYDVSKFLDEHPGGHEVLVKARGSDASEEFRDVGHSLDARELMRKFQVGELVEQDRVEVRRQQVVYEEKSVEEPSFWAAWKIPILLGIVVTVLYSYLF